ncbi:AAA family ATPase [Albibacillus kandeliae]|uniref:AAA family ATPase n=1 Tax=Albibacillus kandeliae TaxID=2174228 RepID=UPI000D685D13|nr:AAA family ATPase [Albibacillus kandeliae]
MSDRFHVVTGGPGAGKTSLIAELARRGVHTVPESGRTIIREQTRLGGSALPWADRAAYALLMLERDIAAWHTAEALTGPVIFDRGIPDVLGYCRLCGLTVPRALDRAAGALRYHRRVMLAPFWPEIFTGDAERKQTPAEAEATSRAMAEAYGGLGYQIVDLPRLDVGARADIVMAQLSGG